MREKKNQLVYPEGHYVWADMENQRETYECFCCSDITQPQTGRYLLAQLTTVADYLTRKQSNHT